MGLAGVGVACKVQTFSLVINNIVCLFQCVDICTDGKKATMNTTVAIFAQIQAVASNYNSSHYLFHCHSFAVKTVFLLKYVLHEERIINILNFYC